MTGRLSQTGLLVGALALAAFSAAARPPVFTDVRTLPDLGLSLPALSDSRGDPLSPPRAAAYLVTTGGVRRLVDRYNVLDLWTCATLRARWVDASGNRLSLARLDRVAPSNPDDELSREEFAAWADSSSAALDPLDASARDAAVALVAPVDVGAGVERRRLAGRGLASVFSYPATNDHAFVYAFRPRPRADMKTKPGWYMAALVVAPGEDADAAKEAFESKFLGAIAVPSRFDHAASPINLDNLPATARLTRLDLHRSVVNYDDWHAADSEDVTVIDDLDGASGRSFVAGLTNDLPRLRAAYAATVPGGLPPSDLAVVRVFRDRPEYIDYVGSNYSWSAAVWAPERRELVLYMPEQGTEELMRTVRHEAFHQYLAYAGSMIPASPWFNEGFADLFANAAVSVEKTPRGGEKVVADFSEAARYAALVRADPAAFASLVPSVLAMDYDAFYGGSDEDRLAHYATAWSLVYFLEKGAPLLRGRPFESFPSDYLKALLDTKNMTKADAAAFGSDEKMALFVRAWQEFWEGR